MRARLALVLFIAAFMVVLAVAPTVASSDLKVENVSVALVDVDGHPIAVNCCLSIRDPLARVDINYRFVKGKLDYIYISPWSLLDAWAEDVLRNKTLLLESSKLTFMLDARRYPSPLCCTLELKPVDAEAELEGNVLQVTLVFPRIRVVKVNVESENGHPLPRAEVVAVDEGKPVPMAHVAAPNGVALINAYEGLRLEAKWWKLTSDPVAVTAKDLERGELEIKLPVTYEETLSIKVLSRNGLPYPLGLLIIGEKTFSIVGGEARVPFSAIACAGVAEIQVFPNASAFDTYSFMGEVRVDPWQLFISKAVTVPVELRKVRLTVMLDTGEMFNGQARVAVNAKDKYGRLHKLYVLSIKAKEGRAEIPVPVAIGSSAISPVLTLEAFNHTVSVEAGEERATVILDLHPPIIEKVWWETRKTTILGTEAYALYVYVKAHDPGPYASGIAYVTTDQGEPLEVAKVAEDTWCMLVATTSIKGAIYKGKVIVVDAQGNRAEEVIEAKLEPEASGTTTSQLKPSTTSAPLETATATPSTSAPTTSQIQEARAAVGSLNLTLVALAIGAFVVMVVVIVPLAARRR